MGLPEEEIINDAYEQLLADILPSLQISELYRQVYLEGIWNKDNDKSNNNSLNRIASKELKAVQNKKLIEEKGSKYLERVKLRIGQLEYCRYLELRHDEFVESAKDIFDPPEGKPDTLFGMAVLIFLNDEFKRIYSELERIDVRELAKQSPEEPEKRPANTSQNFTKSQKLYMLYRLDLDKSPLMKNIVLRKDREAIISNLMGCDPRTVRANYKNNPKFDKDKIADVDHYIKSKQPR